MNRADDFRAFARANWDSLLRTATLLCGNRFLADDLLQEGLMRTYAAWERIADGKQLAYARRVLANICTDQWRRKHVTTVPLDDGVLATIGEADNAQHRVDDRDAILRELATLNQRERTIVVLRYYWDLPEHEVADQLGVSVGTVKSTASRALSKLRVHSLSVSGA